MNCRTTESCNFKRKVGLNLHNVINIKVQIVLKLIKETFEGKNMHTQHNVLGYKIDLYFHDYKLAIEVAQYDHNDRNIDYKIQRQNPIEKDLVCEFIWIDPDEKAFIILKFINKINRQIEKSTKKIFNF